MNLALPKIWYVVEDVRATTVGDIIFTPNASTHVTPMEKNKLKSPVRKRSCTGLSPWVSIKRTNSRQKSPLYSNVACCTCIVLALYHLEISPNSIWSKTLKNVEQKPTRSPPCETYSATATSSPAFSEAQILSKCSENITQSVPPQIVANEKHILHESE